MMTFRCARCVSSTSEIPAPDSSWSGNESSGRANPFPALGLTAAELELVLVLPVPSKLPSEQSFRSISSRLRP